MANKEEKQPQPVAQRQEQQLDTVYVSFSAEINAATTEGLLKVCCDLANKGVKAEWHCRCF